jgi:hypothetical protein
MKNLLQCFICQRKDNLLKVSRKWLCATNDCAVAYYQHLGWLATNTIKKTGRPRLHSYSSERERKAHYRRKKRDKTRTNYYFKKKNIRMKKY